MIAREVSHSFRSIIKDHQSQNVVIVEGARQVGKTYLINSILSDYPNSIKINLETDKILNQKINEAKNFEEFLEILSNEYRFKLDSVNLVFIDEAQENDNIGGFVREMKEKQPLTKWILSGSSMTRLFRDDQRIPVGRISRYKVNPLTFVDFLVANKKDLLVETVLNFKNKYQVNEISDYIHQELLAHYDQYLTVGGLPEVVTDFINKRDYVKLRQQIHLSQQDDFVRKNRLDSGYLYAKALTTVANYLGSQSSLSDLEESYREAKKIYSLLERWHLINKVDLKGTNTTTNFHPKRYVYDIGLAQLLRNHPFPKLSILNTLESVLRTSLGGLFENAVLLSLQETDTDNLNISGWKKNTKEQVEVDFIWRDNEDIYPIECKATLKSPTTNQLSSLKEYLKVTNLKLGFIVTASKFKKLFETEGVTIYNIPIYLARRDVLRALMKNE